MMSLELAPTLKTACSLDPPNAQVSSSKHGKTWHFNYILPLHPKDLAKTEDTWQEAKTTQISS